MPPIPFRWRVVAILKTMLHSISIIRAGKRPRRGQIMIFAILALVILVFVALWNFDLHKIIAVKAISQNAGDSAALAAARWQGQTLNLIGDLNILQAAALMRGEPETAATIADLQARLCYVGPMIGFLAAQQAAKNNGIYVNTDFTDRVRDHALTVRTFYPLATGPSDQPLFPEPFPDAWAEYSGMIEAVAANGIAAAPDNARFYTDYGGDHTLLDPDFYDAIAGRYWCWFYFNHPGLLSSYSRYTDWPPLPPTFTFAQPINSEFFSLDLVRLDLTDDMAVFEVMDSLREERGLSSTLIIATNLTGVTAAWYAYAPDRWTAWDAISPTNNPSFPLAGPVRPEYNYAGADAAIRIQNTVPRRSPGAPSSTLLWSAAAKPFGSLGSEPQRPDAAGLVLPAFHDVRLIPVDASSAPAGGAFNIAWRIHIEQHLPGYMQSGPQASSVDSSCGYCRQLITWEDPSFRSGGRSWLASNSNTCDIAGGPGSPGGGTRRGH
jgi:hypothetical protein